MGQRGPKAGIRIGGRQKGTKNKATIERESGHAEIIERAKAEGVTPLEVMLSAMREAYAKGNMEKAAFFAKDAAPYCHQRLAATELSGNENKPIHIVTGVPSTKEEADILLAMNGHARPN
jgi:hypothetical protein